ncbi:1,6-anhydro-N-acetylmuramyl-L-alanine amidase AmpD [Thiorhodovibrio winogradskyi]|uniref:1,6-anhydro-N-acetylmuramyl-L-alanine amidase AmpD n=1 Tax=Thiorhodovibrio winogradskyi TaxID=77007 RepID=A0ABZ0S6M8_9GAMM|nr:1,6-anhydro-N-acetylmuramyl-L-alanine amidase AmpD [Thiorhodovibrio winogradskyi]
MKEPMQDDSLFSNWLSSGWLRSARPCPSPNHGQRPPGMPVDLLVIHNISLPPGDFGGPWIEQLFLNQLDPGQDPFFATIAGLRVSAHLLIRRDGELVQFVDLRARAWHAGESVFAGRADCNDFSIGIELEGTDETLFTDAQYQRLVGVTKEILRDFPDIKPGRIVGHEHIAPGRKTDPGSCFDWARYLGEVFGRLPAGDSMRLPVYLSSTTGDWD